MVDEPAVLVVGVAPGRGGEEPGRPGEDRAGLLLDTLLAEAGPAGAELVAASLAPCLPPDGRDPGPREVAACVERLAAAVAAARPVVVVALGAFATKLLRGDPAPIRERRGREEARALGGHAFWLLPTFDPAAALYAPASVELLRGDLAGLPALAARGRPALDPPLAPAEPDAPAVTPGQLELF